jgi:hypothetical protein
MGDLIAAGSLIAPHDVLVELEKKEGDTLCEWCRERLFMFQEIDGFQDEIGYVMTKYPRLVDTVKGGTEDKPKMPYVCEQEDLRQIDFLQLIRDQKWTF